MWGLVLEVCMRLHLDIFDFYVNKIINEEYRSIDIHIYMFNNDKMMKQRYLSLSYLYSGKKILSFNILYK